MKTVLLLIVSNCWMTLAWYGHLKFTKTALWIAILASWGLAFVEYCFQVPANRSGYLDGWSAGQLKILQELITLGVFLVFARFYLGERITWNWCAGFALVGAGVFVAFHKW